MQDSICENSGDGVGFCGQRLRRQMAALLEGIYSWGHNFSSRG